MGIDIRSWDEAASFLAGLGVENSFLGQEGFRVDALQYLRLLLEKNESVNLTGAKDLETAFWKHLVDSLSVLSFEPMGSVADWGSGGGLPGIPLALARKYLGSGEQVCFVDSIGKKVAAIKEFASELGLDNTVGLIGRGELLLRSGELGKIETVVMRAVAPPERAVRWVSPLAKNWIFFLGPSQLEGWRRQSKTLDAKGLVLAEEKAFSLPRGLGDRCLLRISKRST